VTHPNSSESLQQPARITGLVLAATTCVIAAGAAFVVATEIFLILFLTMLFGVFLTKTASRVSENIPIGYAASVAAVTTLLVVAGIGSAALFGVQLDQQISKASKHLDEAQLKLNEITEQYPSVKSVLQSTPILSDFLWPDNEGHSRQSKQASSTDAIDATSSDKTGEVQRIGNSEGRSDTVNASDSSLASGTLSTAANKGAQAIAGVFRTTFGLIVNSALIFFIGLFLAVAPEQYRDGVVILFPKSRRNRTRDVLNEIGEALWNWLIGRFGSMLITGLGAVAVLWLAGVPMALVLGLVTSLLTFVPNIGSLIALTLVVLFSLPQGGGTVMAVVVGYMVLQVIESYVVTPLIQQRQVSLPPALLIAVQAVMGVLFGFLGAAVASPLLAAAKTAVEQAYVKDVLGDDD